MVKKDYDLSSEEDVSDNDSERSQQNSEQENKRKKSIRKSRKRFSVAKTNEFNKFNKKLEELDNKYKIDVSKDLSKQISVSNNTSTNQTIDATEFILSEFIFIPVLLMFLIAPYLLWCSLKYDNKCLLSLSLIMMSYAVSIFMIYSEEFLINP